MTPPKSHQNGCNRPAPPRQDQTDQGPTHSANDTEQDEQPMEEESVKAIVTLASTVTWTEQERADFQKATDLARYQPWPDANDDDFADEPLPRPYDPKSSRPYNWASPWIQEKDSEGRTLWRNQITGFITYSRPEGFLGQDGNRSTVERHNNPEPNDHGSERIVRK